MSNIATEYRNADEARGDYLAELAGTDYPAYLSALTDAELASRRKWAGVTGDFWDAAQFANEIARRAA